MPTLHIQKVGFGGKLHIFCKFVGEKFGDSKIISYLCNVEIRNRHIVKLKILIAMKRIHNYLSAMMMAVAAVAMTACEKQEEEASREEGSLTVRFSSEPWLETVTISMDDSENATTRADDARSATRAALQADGKTLTDFWLLDYVDGELKAEIHQTSDMSDFGEPTVRLDYGEHTIYFIASRGNGPNLSTADKTISWQKPLDTFYKRLSLTVSRETAAEQTVTLERVVTKLAIQVTDAVPESVTAFTITPATWYHGLNYESLDATSPQTDTPRTVNITESYYGKENAISASIYGFCPQDGCETDVLLTAADGNGEHIAEATITGASLKVNHVSQYTGTLFAASARQAGFTLMLSDSWGETIEGTW